MAQGKIVQCIGAVIDVEFARNEMPNIYDALKMDGTDHVLQAEHGCDFDFLRKA
jgi:F-type H+-transporting ATPase subunit beta